MVPRQSSFADTLVNCAFQGRQLDLLLEARWHWCRREKPRVPVKGADLKSLFLCPGSSGRALK